MYTKVTAFTVYSFTKEEILAALKYFHPELKGCSAWDLTFFENINLISGGRAEIRKES